MRWTFQPFFKKLFSTQMDHSKIGIDGGFIVGETLLSEYDQTPYYSFKGIPYAHPPVGPLRFKPPKCLERLEGTIECFKDKDACAQRGLMMFPQVFLGSEDCLYLNVYSPKENSSNTLRPVMVFIHGGGFSGGSSDSHIYTPDLLVSKGVVLVTLNYRLNVFGFLNLGLEECPGNVGLLDQRLALTWVKKHISKFMGDPENITLFGESAGSASVHYQMISPLSKGLFHKVILQSGSSLDPWAYMDPSDSIDRAFRVGKLLGCETSNVKELHKFLLNAPLEELREKTYSSLGAEDYAKGVVFPFVPSREIVGTEKFLPEDPDKLLAKTLHVPILCGLNSAEGLLLYVENPKLLPKVLKDVRKVFDTCFPADLKHLTSDGAKLEAARNKVKEFYLKAGATSDSDIVNAYADFSGDINFGRGNRKLLDSILTTQPSQPVYLYQFAFESRLSLARLFGNQPDYLKGACHVDELPLMFFSVLARSIILELDSHKHVAETLAALWTNFAKFGNPNGDVMSDWKPISTDEVSHCVIDEELRIQQGFIYNERIEFWNDLYHSLLSHCKL